MLRAYQACMCDVDGKLDFGDATSWTIEMEFFVRDTFST
jgi:hypothetical protein